jgi:hypothetical protein
MNIFSCGLISILSNKVIVFYLSQQIYKYFNIIMLDYLVEPAKASFAAIKIIGLISGRHVFDTALPSQLHRF